MAEGAQCCGGGEEKTRGWRLGLLLCCCFLFHNSELTRKGLLTAIVMEHVESVATEGALKKNEGRITQQNIDLNQAEPCVAQSVLSTAAVHVVLIHYFNKTESNANSAVDTEVL